MKKQRIPLDPRWENVVSFVCVKMSGNSTAGCSARLVLSILYHALYRMSSITWRWWNARNARAVPLKTENPAGAWKAPARARAARAAPEPTCPPQGNAARPARQGARFTPRERAGARQGARPRASDCGEVTTARRGTAAPDSGQEAHTTMRRCGGTFMPPRLRPCADRR